MLHPLGPSPSTETRRPWPPLAPAAQTLAPGEGGGVCGARRQHPGGLAALHDKPLKRTNRVSRGYRQGEQCQGDAIDFPAGAGSE